MTFLKISYVITVKMCIKLILEMFISLAGYVIQVMSFIINPKPIFALTELKVIIASCIVFSPQKN